MCLTWEFYWEMLSDERDWLVCEHQSEIDLSEWVSKERKYSLVKSGDYWPNIKDHCFFLMNIVFEFWLMKKWLGLIRFGVYKHLGV